MKNKLLIITLLLTIFMTPVMRADEGMWIPLLIEKYNIKLMQEKGFKLSAEDIYSVNKVCMKDAVVLFGGGCTGEVISREGLLITNHHCGYGQIMRHSTLEHDYLTNGFWAMSHDEELKCPGLSVTFLKSMKEVTESVLKGVTDEMTGKVRDSLIKVNIEAVKNAAVEGTSYTARVEPFYMGEQYFLFINEIFKDIRLVGAPPSAIGKFGGETDNWVWPRHTGDFSVFRIYADKNNKPADVSNDNIPYKPAYHFPISLKGYKEGDFTMVFGYPGRTSEYVPSYHIEMVKNYLNPKMIDIRTKKIEIMEAAINSDPLLRLQYSAKKTGIANAWKKWIGENQGLEKMGTIEKKKEFERSLTEWIDADANRKAKYGKILPEYRELYLKMNEYNIVNNYTNEVFFNNGAETVAFAKGLRSLADLVSSDNDEEKINDMKARLKGSGDGFFKNYNIAIDKKLFVTVMKLYGENIDPKWQAPEYIKLKKSCNGDFSSIVDKLYANTVFSDQARYNKFVAGFKASDIKKLNKDPFYLLSISAGDLLSVKVKPELERITSEITKLNKDYMTLQMEFDKEKLFYPDANLTLRITYGKVKGYNSKDAVYFKHYTTLKGIMEKDRPEIYDYDVPDKLKELYKAKDFGPYTQDGEVPVCFIADNHTTGGNSGSPVINAEGQLIGINFDRAWEGVASDMAFNPDQSRNISLDIRYALFIIDKFAGAGYLLNEMTLIGKSSD